MGFNSGFKGLKHIYWFRKVQANSSLFQRLLGCGKRPCSTAFVNTYLCMREIVAFKTPSIFARVTASLEFPFTKSLLTSLCLSHIYRRIQQNISHYVLAASAVYLQHQLSQFKFHRFLPLVFRVLKFRSLFDSYQGFGKSRYIYIYICVCVCVCVSLDWTEDRGT